MVSVHNTYRYDFQIFRFKSEMTNYVSLDDIHTLEHSKLNVIHLNIHSLPAKKR